MPSNVFIGELEQLVLLTLLRLGERGYALPLREDLSRVAGRSLSRGALYRTLERREANGFVSWSSKKTSPTAAATRAVAIE